MNIDKEKILRVFREYVEKYDSSNEKVRLKIEHTYRVSSLCREIAKSLYLSGEDVSLSWLLGILHDVGRFEQLKNYGTFIDAQSIDHAVYGAEILFKQGKIRDYIEDKDEDILIETVIKYHSAYRLPENLDERTKMFCQILRDSDKIDILKVNVDFPLEEIYNVTTNELRTSAVSGKVMQAFCEEHAVLRSLKKTPVDYVTGHISLVYELVYAKSISIAKEQGYIKKLMDFKSDNPKTEEQFRQIRSVMNAYLEKRSGSRTDYKNYIFDLYGTLVDIHTDEKKEFLWENMARIFSMMGAVYEKKELEEAYLKLVKQEERESVFRAQKTFEDENLCCQEAEVLLENVFGQLFLKKNIQADKRQIRQMGIVFRSLSISHIRLFDGARALLERLRKNGKKIYLLSNAQRMFTEPEMKMLGIYEYFDGILYSSDQGVKKPSSYFYDALFKQYGLNKEESVMIGNEYQADIYGADNYGIKSMYIYTAQSGKEAGKLPEGCQRIGHISETYP